MITANIVVKCDDCDEVLLFDETVIAGKTVDWALIERKWMSGSHGNYCPACATKRQVADGVDPKLWAWIQS